MRRVFGFLLVLSLFAMAFPASLHVQAQGVGYQYFNETRHNVRGEFLTFYRAAVNPTLLYGYPITEEMASKDGQTRVQYFQRARFEYHPERPEGQRVTLTALGRKTYKPGGQINVSTNLGCRRFESSYAVCFSFLEFYDKYGGKEQFGNPISPFEIQNDMIVQHFENARFEWQPNKPEGQRVVLTDLGRVYFSQVNEDTVMLNAALPLDNTIVPSIQMLQVRAFAWKAVTLSTDQQLLYVIVQDQTQQPVPNANVNIKVFWPAGVQEIIDIKTNNNGLAMIPLTVSNQPYGQVIRIEVTVTYNGLNGFTSTSFRIWY